MFEEILAKIGIAFKKNKIPYMIIGGQAVLLYGEPRLTRDIDITLGLTIDHLDEILNIVYSLNLKPLPDNIESFVRQTMVLPSLDESTGIRLDLIFSYTPYKTEAIKRAREIKILSEKVYFASPEDVIIHKIFAGRPRDLEDVRTILLKNPDIDIQYIQNWLKEFDEASDKKDFQKIFEKILRETE